MVPGAGSRAPREQGAPGVAQVKARDERALCCGSDAQHCRGAGLKPRCQITALPQTETEGVICGLSPDLVYLDDVTACRVYCLPALSVAGSGPGCGSLSFREFRAWRALLSLRAGMVDVPPRPVLR